MIGDSITDAGRNESGEGLFEAIGRGYVAQVDALLNAAYPAHAIRVTNRGTSGNTVRDLAKRWQTDVLALQPDWLSIMIGINDVWRQFDLPRQPELHVHLDEYRTTLEQLVVSTRPLLKGLVLMTPFFIEPNRHDPMRQRMDAYGAVVREIASRHQAIAVDTQAAFDQVLIDTHPMSLAWDRVHPNHIGQMVITRAFLNGIGFAWAGQSAT
jgi:lysophospholipase L1-like esterase